MITLERAGQIVAMCSGEIFDGIKIGEVDCEEFKYWAEDRRVSSYNAGYDNGYHSHYDSDSC